MTKRIKKYIDDDAWLTDHFEKIVDKYAGQHIIIANHEVFTGENASAKAKRKYPHIIPLSMPVPKPEDFMCVLMICLN